LSTHPSHSTRLVGWRPLLVLSILLLAAAGLRLHRLDAESAWLDEAFAIGIARTDVAGILHETRLDVHPPLYYFILHAWVLLLDGSVWTARLLSVLCSLGILVASYVVGARLVSRPVGLTAAALLAVSVFQVEFAQEARMYALLTLLATISTYGFIRLFERPRLHWFLLYAAVTALMVYTHVYATFIIGAQGASLVVDVLYRRGASRDVLLRWLGALGLVFAAFLPWLSVFVWQVSLVQRNFWIGEPEWNGILSAFLTYAGSLRLYYVYLGLMALGALHLWRRPRAPEIERPALFFLVPWLLGPIVFPFVLSLIGSPIFLPKYTIAASVPFAILLAAGLASLPFRALRAAALATCLAMSLQTLPAYYDTQTKDGWREAVATVESAAHPGDLIVLYPYFNQIAFNFYLEREDVVVRPFPVVATVPPEDGWDVVMQRAVTDHRRVWFVTLDADASAHPVIAQFQQRFAEASHAVVQKVAVYQFERGR
jgi:uncharacterized membrane protein